MSRPRLLPNYDVRLIPGGDGAEDVLVCSSQRRTVRLEGRSFARFVSDVLPLLDGSRTLEEIQAAAAAAFRPEDVANAIALMTRERLIEDAGGDLLDEASRAAFAPQLAWLHEFTASRQHAQVRLQNAAVGVVGGGPSAIQALALLKASGAGNLFVFDPDAVSLSDSSLQPLLPAGLAGTPRSRACQDIAGAQIPDSLAGAVSRVEFVIASVDPARSSLLYQLNKECHSRKIPWTTGCVSAHEVHIGPTVLPGETSCFLCYKMRAVSCAADPAGAFAYEQFLDRRGVDESARRENLPALAGLLGCLLAMEAIKSLLGLPVPTAGRLAVFNTLALETTYHVVLRKPWCPVCGV